jgi:hypothetical protein
MEVKRKMAKKSKRRLLLITAVILLLFIFGTFTTVISKVYAADVTVQQKGLAILKEAVGLDTAEYAVNTKEQSKDSYMGVLPEEDVRYELNSNVSNIKIRCTFVDGKLLMLDVLENQGSPRLTKTVNGIAEMAKDFLNSYQSYSGNSLYGELRSSLVGVDSSNNSTKTVGNTKLEVSNYRERVTFRWIYTFNGVEAPDKVVALGYEKGFLEYFFDSWDLYKIGSTDINVSEEEAINLGMARARNYSWPAGSNETMKVKNFNVTGAMMWETVFRNSLVADNARNEDLLMLYPMRHVWVSLDKFYPPGNVYGFNVYVWADTGEVCYIQERISTVDPPPELVATVADATDMQANTPTAAFEATSTSSTNTLIALTPCGLLVIGVAWVWLRRKKNVYVRRLFRLDGLLLCLLVLSLFSVPIATVNAASPKGRAVVWGSESSGAYYDPPGFSWRKHPIEVTRQNAIAAYITENFSSNGYEASDYQGNLGYNPGSWKVDILEKTSENDALYPRVAVVDFDHGNGLDGIPGLPSSEFHYMFEDNHGTKGGPYYDPGPYLPEYGVYDFEIYPRTAEGKIFFAFINTCNSAHIDENFNGYYSKQGIVPGTDRARGMPFAWSHRRPGIDMSADGYGSPDSGDFVFIGFKGGSAALMQAVEGSYPTHYAWVMKFFNDSLSDDVSVNEALDSASRYYFSGDNFDQTAYYDDDGFTAVWPMYYDGEWHFTGPGIEGCGWMKVYGNGNIHLYQKGGVWNLDENSGTTAHDSLLNNDGTIYGATWTTGKIGSALSYDGVDDYVSVASVSGLSGNTPHSIEAWVKVNSLPSNRAWILLLGNEGVGSHHWLINSQGGTQFGVWGGGQTQPTLPVGQWTHIAITFDGTTLKSYVNGEPS